MALSNILLTDVYDFIVILCDYSFNYCPLHYQMLYFYFPILYLFMQKSYESNLQNTTYNYVYIILLLNLRKAVNVNFITKAFKNFLYKIFCLTNLFVQISIQPIIKSIYVIFKKNFYWINWKPVFKKTSYFGVFSYVRSKWYK